MNAEYKLTAVAALLVAGQVAAQVPELVIKVANSTKKPIPGTVYLVPGDKVLGKTSASGELRLKRACAEGDQFKAIPEDRSEYYDSKPTVCSSFVELLVLPRPPEEFTAWSSLYFSEVASTKEAPTKFQLYGGVHGGIYTAQMEVPGTVASGSPRCQVTLSRKYDLSYLNTKTNAWQKVQIDGAVPSVPISPETKFFFPTTCDEAQPRILDLKRTETRTLDSKLRQYYLLNSDAIETAIKADIKKEKF